MRRPKIVRLQLVLLVLVLALLFGRRMMGSERPEGFVVLSDLEPHHLAHERFILEQPATIAVSATGSFEQSPSGTAANGPLAAYAWILRRDDHEVVWQMTPRNAQTVQGTLAQASDTLSFPPGTYDVYFASFGNRTDADVDGHRSFFHRFTRAGLRWMSDAEEWMFALRAVGGTPAHLSHVTHDQHGDAPAGPDVIWTSGPVRNGMEVEYLFDVQRPVVLSAYTVGQIGSGEDDYAWIEDALTGEHRWTMSEENTLPAGGAAENRYFQGDVRLEPGVYRAVYKTGRIHAFSDWTGNPPFDPEGWGLTLRHAAPEASGVQSFDPWANRSAIASITRVQDDRQDIVQFKVNQSLPVFAYALGEMVDDRPFDWAWLQDDATGQRVWEMEGEHTRHAGGASKNRVETAFLNLEPGTYTLHYETDDSHAYDDWNDDPPPHPERWGVSLFPVSASLQPGAVQILARREKAKEKEWESADAEHPDVPEVPVPPVLTAPSGSLTLNWTALPNETERETILDLPAKTTFHVHALGEITPRGAMDFGWIENVETGERVWEMKWDNTHPAGGDDRNRLFDGMLTLDPGQYQIHFETDMSHAVGDFREYAPHNPEAWGITITSVK